MFVTEEVRFYSLTRSLFPSLILQYSFYNKVELPPLFLLFPGNKLGFDWSMFWHNRKSLSWNTLRSRKRAEKDSAGVKGDAKLENGLRKPKEILSTTKVTVKVSKQVAQSDDVTRAPATPSPVSTCDAEAQ